ncbi:MAG: PAS domain-containing protein, partial [Candidatus Hydrogenedentes bacterium]|nr:PAS domain-containing protein [Candidatus Hydrogenedentota bacterium]
MGTKHTEKTKTQLINEVRKLKQRLAELETKNVGHTPANTTAGNGHLFDLLSWDIFPHPVMVICKDKRVVAANEFACRAGAVVGEHCSRCCGLRDDGPDEDVECIKNGEPSSANRCAFCLVDKAFETQCPANIPEITVSGKIWNVSWVPLDDDLCLCYAIDITAWKRIERDALQSDAVLEAVAFMVHEFAVSNRWKDTINVSLARLGEAMNVSRVCVFENHEGEGGEPLTSLRYEWVARGIEPCAGRPDFMNIPLRDDKMECHASILSQGDIIRTNVRELPTSEQSAFLGRDVMSVVLLPIFVSNRWWGFVKIDVCKAERDWSDVVINVLRTGADVIGLAIERANAVETLARSEERYELAQQSAHIGTWDYDLITGHIEWSSTIEPMFGLARGEFGGTYADFLKCVYPDDLQYVMDAVNAALECAERTREHYIEHRILRPDGTVRWVAETAKILRDKSGNAVRMIGTVQDITRRKEVEEQLDKFVKLQKMRLREINHRVENTLSSIISMLN